MKQKGFTLIEIMIALVILAILASIAITSYQRYLLRSHRTDAMKLLLDTAGAQESLYSFKYKYTGSLEELGLSSNKSDYGYYQLSIQLDNNEKSYILTAMPIGSQANDECGSFQLYSDGTRQASKEGCWK